MADSAIVIPDLDEPITTPRLMLRAVEADDVATSVQLMADPEAQRHFHGPLDVEGARQRSRGGVGKPGRFCIVLRSSGERLRFVTIAPEKRTKDLAVSYALLSEHWGHGYAREAVPRFSPGPSTTFRSAGRPASSPSRAWTISDPDASWKPSA